jgi:hypothetical protein
MSGAVLYSEGIVEIIEILKLLGGDPRTIDTSLFYEQGTVTAAAAVPILRVQSNADIYSILQIQFSQTSGRGRYLTTGGLPSAAGFGMPILSGGTELIIRGAENINRFLMIAEAGETMEYNAQLFKAQAWAGIR